MSRQRRRRRRLAFDLVQFVFKDVADAFVGTDASWQGAPAGRFQPSVAVVLTQTENAQAGTVSLLRMAPALQHERR
jgi:hypothetical protein